MDVSIAYDPRLIAAATQGNAGVNPGDDPRGPMPTEIEVPDGTHFTEGMKLALSDDGVLEEIYVRTATLTIGEHDDFTGGRALSWYLFVSHIPAPSD